MKKHYSVEIAGKYGGGRSPSNLLDKITRRYSAIGSRLMRKSPGRKSGVADPITGSYDMSGGRSDDFRPEIGVPILISKTMKFDFDDEPGNPPTNNLSSSTLAVSPRQSQSPVPVSVATRSTSDDSENDIFVDANSSLPNFSDIKFTFLATESNNNHRDCPDENNKENMQKSRSKSAHNLHQPELRLSLDKTPSLNFSALSNGGLQTTSITVPNSPAVDSIYDFPRSTKVDDCSFDLDHANLILNEINLSLVNDGGDVDHHPDQHLYHNVPPQSNGGILHNHAFEYAGSNQSFHSNSTQEEEFDLKSASFQSLDARNLFLSIEELEEITRQINESSDIFKETSNEYCEHRKQLHPTERRLTLLKNKSSHKHFIDFDKKKAKLTRKWSGFKHWIGEEQDKIKEVVQKHAAMQRVGLEGSGGGTGGGGKKRFSDGGGSEVGGSEMAVAESELNVSASVVDSENKDRSHDSEERDASRTRSNHNNSEILEVS
ncbi:uncharacterized protein LOC129743412 [Uranotaenia lowii]|uniref:uncharacterized protein LOC129743412 n=1 Tax=Uranotaenia lowii TaxID=190385 RepID=UPI002478AF69|nr:uncharacterized protein LOC129743412 [Uranotaenia lowii]